MSSLTARRILATGSVIAFFGLAVLLLWSDRAIAYLGDFVDFGTRIGRRAEAESGLDLIDRSDVPGQNDDLVHAVFWGSGMLLFGWLLRRRVPVILTALFVAGTSIVFELLQPVISTKRATESTDAVSNLIGVAAATVFLLVVTRIMRVFWGDHRRYHGDQLHHRDEPTDEYVLS